MLGAHDAYSGSAQVKNNSCNQDGNKIITRLLNPLVH
jgi:hypothetical protein